MSRYPPRMFWARTAALIVLIGIGPFVAAWFFAGWRGCVCLWVGGWLSKMDTRHSDRIVTWARTGQ